MVANTYSQKPGLKRLALACDGALAHVAPLLYEGLVIPCRGCDSLTTDHIDRFAKCLFCP